MLAKGERKKLSENGAADESTLRRRSQGIKVKTAF
jgi:hypothetical protein